MRERFYLPEEKTNFTFEDAEQANASVKSQTRLLFFVGAILSVFFGITCYSATSLNGFLVYVIVVGLFLYGLWRFHNRVEGTERHRNTEKQTFPAEELFLSERDMSWEIKSSNPEKIIIPWENIAEFGDGRIECKVNGRTEKISTPRVVLANYEIVVESIEKYTKLKKVIKQKFLGGEIMDVVYYEK